ncbi:MAG TPA: IS481 family transposase [Candidatus Dormibacteraeota bacterium]|nr:IS481 family transposase [Candidatus Dormibacteraeota bacterium]
MVLWRYLVDAVVLEGRSPIELARSHGISQSWIYEQVKRFREGGYPALEPRSRRPHSCPHQVSQQVEGVVLELRRELIVAGHDAGAQSIAHHLVGRVDKVPSLVTIWRILSRNGLITPEPHKRPRCSFKRFQAELPNQMWQADSTHWQLADDSEVEILNMIDDHSRLVLASVALTSLKAGDAHEIFIAATESHGLPASLLCDNAAVFSGKSRRGKVVLEAELERLGIRCIHSTPYHPQTCGKVERFHQTLKRFLVRQVAADSLPLLQLQLDNFRCYYNQQRPHRALAGSTPLVAFNARVKAKPEPVEPPTHFRVRRDKVDRFGRVTLRYLGQLHHIGVGLAYKNRPIRLLVAGDHVRVVTEEGSLLRELVIDPSRDYQPLGGRTLFRHVVRQASAMS